MRRFMFFTGRMKHSVVIEDTILMHKEGDLLRTFWPTYLAFILYAWNRRAGCGEAIKTSVQKVEAKWHVALKLPQPPFGHDAAHKLRKSR